MNVWSAVVTVGGSVLAMLGVVFTARATSRAAAATARANEAATRAQAEPNQRAADLQSFQVIRTDMQDELNEIKSEARSTRSLVRSFAWYVSELTTQMRSHGIEPSVPPERIQEYNRTGV